MITKEFTIWFIPNYIKMEKFSQINTNKRLLNLRTWWIQIEKADVENIINKWDRWNYWRCDDTYITTLQNWKLAHYKINETEVLTDEKNRRTPNIKTIKERQSELLTDLFLSPNNQVKCTSEAYEKAKYSDKTEFWFISKGKNKAVVVLDFSKWKKPKISKYPLNKYKIKLKAIEV